MKRSEFLNKLDNALWRKWGFDFDYSISELSTVIELAEELGMMPPMLPIPEYQFQAYYAWEPEELTTEENIADAKAEVATWPQWKIENMKAVFSEPSITVPEGEDE